MRFVCFICAYCGQEAEHPTGHVNRSRKKGAPLYCDMGCSGAARRTTLEDKKAKKAAYDRELRIVLADKIKREKAEYFRCTYDPEKARIERKKTMPYHVEYCRQPQYKAKKHDYDLQRTVEPYGPYGEAYRMLLELESAIREIVPDKYERLKAQGYFDPQLVRERKVRWQSKSK